MENKQIVIQKSPSTSQRPSASFSVSEFEQLIFQKGYEVIHEKALKCPCKSKNSNQQSNCKNCGGTGWVFINPVKTRMILHSMNLNTQYKEWTELKLGTVSISALPAENLSYMDRITVVEGKASFSEVLHFSRIDGNVLFASSTYRIKEVFYVGLFVTVNSKLSKLEQDIDYTFESNRFYLDAKYSDGTDEQDISVTIRYEHSPEYHVLDLQRETMQSFYTKETYESLIDLPISGIGKRAHYIMDMENISGTRLLDNSFIDLCNDTLE